MISEVREVISYIYISVVILKEKTDVKGGFVSLTREMAATDSASSGKMWSDQNPFHDLDHRCNHPNP